MSDPAVPEGVALYPCAFQRIEDTVPFVTGFRFCVGAGWS